MGYSETQRRALNVSIAATAYKERDLIGVGYVIEQATQAAQARQRGQPEHVPLREDGAGAAVRRARRLQPGLRRRRWTGRHARRRCRSRSRRSRRRACRRGMTAGTLTRGDADEGVPRADRADQRGGPGDPGGPRPSTRTRSTRRRRSTPSARPSGVARPAARHPGAAGRLIDVARAGDDRRLDRAAALQARRGLDARREAQGGGRDHPRQDERLRAGRPVRREHARGLLVARRPGAAAVGHRQDAGRLVRRLGRGDGRPAWRR